MSLPSPKATANRPRRVAPLFHGAADVFTLGLWEVIGTPTEAVFDGTQMRLEVTYDESDRIQNVVNLQQPK